MVQSLSESVVLVKVQVMFVTFQNSMKKFGCVTPFGYNKSNICTNSTLAKQAIDYYTKEFKSLSDNCLNPCNYFIINAIKLREDKKIFGKNHYAYVQLSFNEYIKTTTSYYSYLTLSMVAEIGGYVGLFLGVSLYQTTDILDAIKNRMN